MVCPFCDFTCEGCQNKHLVDCEVKEFSVEDLVYEYKSNPFYDGVTLGGLEVTFSGDDFIDDFIDFIKKAGIKNVCIYTRESETNPYILRILKGLHLVCNLYIKTGRYISCLPSLKVKVMDWCIELGSSNQKFKRL
jgi:hypothetical protein